MRAFTRWRDEPLLRKHQLSSSYTEDRRASLHEVDESGADELSPLRSARFGSIDSHPIDIPYKMGVSYDTAVGYNSEGGTARQMTNTTHQRHSRMPKRGGRNRIRRAAVVERGRVSSYCLSSELKIEALLEYLQAKPDRKDYCPTPRSALAKRHSAPAAHAHARADSDSDFQWVDVLYSDVIHSTTTRPVTEERKPKKGEGAEAYKAEMDSFGGGGGGGVGADGEATPPAEMPTPHIGKDMFILPYGCIIFWGMTVVEEVHMLAEIRKFSIAPVSDGELQQSQDDMTFCYADAGGEKSAKVIKADELVLGTDSALEKLSYSYALAQSAKLFVFEDRLGDIVEQTRVYPEELRVTGKILLSQTDMSKLIGKVLVARNDVNLHSDVLHTPEFFWETQTWEPEYQRLCTYLDMPLRLLVINKRLDVLRELLDVLHNQVTNTHAIRLEVIVIYLIALEVVLELFWNVFIKDICGFFK